VSQKHLDAAIRAFGCTAQQNLLNHLWSLLSIKLNKCLFFLNEIYYYYFLVVKILIYLPVLSVPVNDSLGNCQGKPNGVGHHLAKHQQKLFVHVGKEYAFWGFLSRQDSMCI
jgi:hypothetical protein